MEAQISGLGRTALAWERETSLSTGLPVQQKLPRHQSQDVADLGGWHKAQGAQGRVHKRHIHAVDASAPRG